jgi:small conductance mechanosensitive channel
VTPSTPLSALLTRWAAIEPETAAVLTRLISVVVTALVLVVIYHVAIRLLTRALARVVRDRETRGVQPYRIQRVRTLGSLLVNVTRWLAAFIILVVVLKQLGIDLQALLVSAGLVGLAVGLGAQALIRDIITGVFLLFEGLIAVGDVVEIGDKRGTVESIGLRVTQLRLPDGSLRVIPNGQLTDFTNMSTPWARAVVDVGVSREVDVARALDVLTRVGAEWSRASGGALETPEARGIIKFSGGDVVLRLAVRVDPARRFDTEIELRRRIKEAFDREHWAPVGVA